MSSWLIGITGAILLTTLIDVLMAEGETKKYVKGVAALLVFAAIIAPLPSLFNKEWSLDYGSAGVVETPMENDTYLERVYMERYKNYELVIQNKLKAAGISEATVRIDIRYYGGAVSVDFVTADLTRAVISTDNPNIDINSTVKKTVRSTLTTVTDAQIIVLT